MTSLRLGLGLGGRGERDLRLNQKLIVGVLEVSLGV